MITAQEYLDQNYPKENRSKITELRIDEKGLQGSLDLTDFTNLEHLACFKNELTYLNVNNLTKLKFLSTHTNKLTKLNINTNNCLEITVFDCGANCLTEFSLSFLDSEKLEYLSLCSNKFPPHDLSCFSRFVNLKTLIIAGSNFYGSLEPLKDLKKLEGLHIQSSDIDDNLEYLPNSLKEDWFYFEGSKKIVDKLAPFSGKLKVWKEANLDKVKITQQGQQIEELKEQVQNQGQKIQELEKQLIQLTQKVDQLQVLGTENNHLKSQLTKMEELLGTEQETKIIQQDLPR